MQQMVITQRARTPCFFGMMTTVFLSYLKTNFKMSSDQFDLHFTLPEMS